MKEADILRTIMAWLKVHRIWHRRWNSGAFVGQYKGKRRFVKFGKSGDPDILVLHKGRTYGLEVKAPCGEQSTVQVEAQVEFERAGGVYCVVRSLEDVFRVIGPDRPGGQ